MDHEVKMHFPMKTVTLLAEGMKLIVWVRKDEQNEDSEVPNEQWKKPVVVQGIRIILPRFLGGISLTNIRIPY